MKKYVSYKDSGIEWIGVIPEHWDRTKFGYQVYIKRGVGYQYIEQTEDDDFEPVIRISDFNSFYPLKAKKRSELNNYRVYSGDILIAGTGATAGISIKVDSDMNSMVHSYNALRLVSKGKSNNSYIFYCLNSHLVEEQKKLAFTGSAQPFLDVQRIANLEFIIPPINEQNVIANYLDYKTAQIDHLIAKKEQFIQLLEEERVAVINQAVTKGLDPSVPMKDSGIEWLGEIPEHWEVKKLKQIFNSSKGLTITKENLESEGIPCVNYGEIHSKFGFEVDIDKHQLKCVNPSYLESDYKSLIQTGDFVFADTSEDVSGAGNFTYLKSNHEIFAGYHTIILRALVDIESRYFAYQFDSIPYRTQIRQSVKGIKVFSITQGILKNTSLWIPPIDEQKQIIEFLDIETNRIVRLKNSAVKEIELLKEFKTALISEVVTGKVDVRNEKLN